MTATHDLTTRRVPIDSLRPHPRNAREGDIDAIAASLAEHGQFRPIVATTDGHILAGNHTWMAAASLSWQDIDTVTLDIPHDDPRAIKIMLADNRTAELGGYDDGLLLDLLDSLDGDLGATGYTATDVDELARSLAEPPEGDPDDVPTPRRGRHTCTTGDLWRLGDHYLAVGDSLDPAVLDTLLGDVRPDMLCTDPPYGVNYVGKTRDALTIDNDWSSGLHEFLTTAYTNAAQRLRPGATFYLFTPTGINHLDHRLAARDSGLAVRSSIVWVKDRFVLGHSDYHARHETLLYGWTDGPHTFHGQRVTDDVWEFDRPARNEEHPTIKPVALIENTMAMSTNPGDVVLDIFAGSGTAIIAAHRTGRRCYAVEQDEGYADVICRRYQDYTGIVPVRVADDMPVTFIKDAA